MQQKWECIFLYSQGVLTLLLCYLCEPTLWRTRTFKTMISHGDSNNKYSLIQTPL